MAKKMTTTEIKEMTVRLLDGLPVADMAKAHGFRDEAHYREVVEQMFLFLNSLSDEGASGNTRSLSHAMSLLYFNIFTVMKKAGLTLEMAEGVFHALLIDVGHSLASVYKDEVLARAKEMLEESAGEAMPAKVEKPVLH